MVEDRQRTIADLEGAMSEGEETHYVAWVPAASSPAQIQLIPLESIIVEERIRQDMGDVRTLAESIEGSGLLHPVIVDEGYRLLAGERRLRAHHYLGRTHIEARVMSGLSAIEKEVIELDENRRRQDFSPNELARYYVQKKEYVESSLRMLKLEQQRKLEEERKKQRQQAEAEREQERREYETRLREVEAREADILARLAEFDARLQSQEANSTYVESYQPSDREVAARLGIADTTLDRAEAHVAAMDKYPFLDSKEWNQAAALEVAGSLAVLQEQDEKVHDRFVVLLREIRDARRIREAVRMWVSSSPEKQQRIGVLLTGEDAEARAQVEAYLAGNNLQPDPRRVRLHGILAELQHCCGPVDLFQPRFTALRDAVDQLARDIRAAEEKQYGWLR